MVVMMRKAGVRLVQAIVWHHSSVQFLIILLHHQIGGRDDLRGELRRSLARCLCLISIFSSARFETDLPCDRLHLFCVHGAARNRTRRCDVIPAEDAARKLGQAGLARRCGPCGP